MSTKKTAVMEVEFLCSDEIDDSNPKKPVITRKARIVAHDLVDRMEEFVEKRKGNGKVKDSLTPLGDDRKLAMTIRVAVSDIDEAKKWESAFNTNLNSFPARIARTLRFTYISKEITNPPPPPPEPEPEPTEKPKKKKK